MDTSGVQTTGSGCNSPNIISPLQDSVSRGKNLWSIWLGLAFLDWKPTGKKEPNRLPKIGYWPFSIRVFHIKILGFPILNRIPIFKKNKNWSPSLPLAFFNLCPKSQSFNSLWSLRDPLFTFTPLIHRSTVHSSTPSRLHPDSPLLHQTPSTPHRQKNMLYFVAIPPPLPL